YEHELTLGFQGVCPHDPALRAFCDVAGECAIPLEEPMRFLGAMRSDLTIRRYATYEDLRSYMRGSAAAVGVMMCSVLGASQNEIAVHAAKSLGEAMQLTNFLRDVGEDASRGRIYLPEEDLTAFGVSEQDVLDGRITPGFTDLMKFQIDRARSLYRSAEKGVALLPKNSRKAVRLAAILYSRILSRIEAGGYDVFQSRARTSKAEKMTVAARVLAGF
ncbi:MAG TPA: phytoene/squalene synthase family protein, partial [Fimbriimonas sp.]|nr:phytoene/squalene synthase family protein [Fimbriimonas sp.]